MCYTATLSSGEGGVSERSCSWSSNGIYCCTAQFQFAARTCYGNMYTAAASCHIPCILQLLMGFGIQFHVRIALTGLLCFYGRKSWAGIRISSEHIMIVYIIYGIQEALLNVCTKFQLYLPRFKFYLCFYWHCISSEVDKVRVMERLIC